MSVRATAFAAFCLASLAAPTAALAEEPIDGLSWRWSDKELRYHIHATIFVPDWHWFRAVNNYEVRVNEMYVELVTTCKPVGPGKKAWDVACSIDAIGIEAAPLPADADQGRPKGSDEPSNLDRILEEWGERLTKEAKLRMIWGENGKIKSFTLGGLSRLNRRDGENIEYMRQLLNRVFSPLEIGMPKKGTDKGNRSWSEKGPLIAVFMGAATVGNVDTTHQINAQRGDMVRIATQGEGTVSNAGRTVNVGGQEQLSDTFKVGFWTESFFDVSAGHLLRREVIFDGKPTASSMLADGTEGLPYIQTYRVQLLSADEETPLVMTSREIASRLFNQSPGAASGGDSSALPAPPADSLPSLPAPPGEIETLPPPPTEPKSP